MENKTFDFTTATIFLPYFKQGDDLRHHLDSSKELFTALTDHARMLRFAAEQLDDIKDEICRLLIFNTNYDISDITIDADCHHISITGPSDFIKILIDKKLAEIDEDFEEDNDYNNNDLSNDSDVDELDTEIDPENIIWLTDQSNEGDT